jgi:hypothetical protein
MVAILLFLILCALSPRLAWRFAKVVCALFALLVGLVILAAWPHIPHH